VRVARRGVDDVDGGLNQENIISLDGYGGSGIDLT
jgi:hypothetical protein